MERIPLTAVFLALVSGSACSGLKPSQERLDTIALCNAGYNVSVGMDLEADVRALAIGRPLQAGVSLKQSLTGQFVNNAQVSEENAVLLYESYVNCVQSEQSFAELVAILQQRRQVLIDRMTKNGQMESLEEFELLFPLYIKQTQTNQKVAAHETGRQIQQILMRAADQVQAETGQRPDYLLTQRKGRTIKDTYKLRTWRSKEEALAKKELPWCFDAAYRTVEVGEYVYREREPCRDIVNDLGSCSGLAGQEKPGCQYNDDSIGR